MIWNYEWTLCCTSKAFCLLLLLFFFFVRQPVKNAEIFIEIAFPKVFSVWCVLGSVQLYKCCIWIAHLHCNVLAVCTQQQTCCSLIWTNDSYFYFYRYFINGPESTMNQSQLSLWLTRVTQKSYSLDSMHIAFWHDILMYILPKNCMKHKKNQTKTYIKCIHIYLYIIKIYINM